MSIDIDADIADDLMSSFDEHYDELQHALNKLSHHTDDTELINRVFRSMHTIKGNASMVQIQPLVDFAHGMEETIDSMRSGNFSPTEAICDLLLTGTDRLRDLHKYHLFNKPFETIDEEAVAEGFKQISLCNSTEATVEHTQTLYRVFYPDAEDPEITIDDTFSYESISDHTSYLEGDEETFNDLTLFRDLALQTDLQNNFWGDRTDRLIYLGIKLSYLSRDIRVDKNQLVAAIYMHDIGMAFIPHDIINKQSKLNAMELKKLQRHVDWGHQIISRMPNWQEAAVMVLQHHEQEDGSGYPNGLTTDQLSEGAKIIAILDAFYAMTNLRSDRSHRRSILRAISEINACSGTQFNKYWVELFNQLIKSEVKNGTM